MAFKSLCILLLRTKVALALEGLILGPAVLDIMPFISVLLYRHPFIPFMLGGPLGKYCHFELMNGLILILFARHLNGSGHLRHEWVNCNYSAQHSTIFGVFTIFGVS